MATAEDRYRRRRLGASEESRRAWGGDRQALWERHRPRAGPRESSRTYWGVEREGSPQARRGPLARGVGSRGACEGAAGDSGEPTGEQADRDGANARHVAGRRGERRGENPPRRGQPRPWRGQAGNAREHLDQDLEGSERSGADL